MDTLEEIFINGESFKVELSFVNALSSKVSIRNRKILIKISRYLRRSQREEIFAKHLLWAIKKIEEADKPELLFPEIKDFTVIKTHNKVYEVHLFREFRKKSLVRLKNNYIIELRLSVELDDEQIKEKASRFVSSMIIKDQAQYLYEVIYELNLLFFNEEIKSLRFRRMKSRFGSCSSGRNISISFCLLFAPREVFRYVCVHELAHLKEMNHSKKFWKIVENAMPDYKIHRKWLRDKGFLL